MARIDPAVLPDILAVTTASARSEVVAMGRSTALEDKTPFVAGAIEGSHAAIILRPNDKILELGKLRIASCENLAHVQPVCLLNADGGQLHQGLRDMKKQPGYFA